jgi:biopolymer transport protein ExbB
MQQFFWYFKAGGILIWPLLACSLLALAVVIERAIRLRRSAIVDASAIEDIQKLLETGELKRAIEKHQAGPTLLERIICRALADETWQINEGDFEKNLLVGARRGLAVLTNNLNVLAVIAKVAPLIGLLGTVFGMIAGFEALEKAGVGKAQLAGAIRIALITTAAGLLVAIPSVIALAFFRSRLRRYQAEFEEIFEAVARSAQAGSGKIKKEEPEDSSTSIKKDDEEHFQLPSILTGKG